jgi:Cupredoxin-like domain
MALATGETRMKFGACLLGLSLLVAGSAPRVAMADDAVTLSLTLQDQKFDPAELHAPAGKAFDIRLKSLNTIASEFESGELHFEKIVPPGGEIVVHVRPQQPGRYMFFDDFHHETQGVLIVP